MKKFLLLFSFWFCIEGYSFSQSEYKGQKIEDIIKLPENEINIGIASLVLARELYPNLDVSFFLQAFDYLADRYKYYFGKYAKPEERIRALNTYFYRPGFWNDSVTFSYDNDDLYVTQLRNQFINGYISSKKGSCITMPLLYGYFGRKIKLSNLSCSFCETFFCKVCSTRS